MLHDLYISTIVLVDLRNFMINFTQWNLECLSFIHNRKGWAGVLHPSKGATFGVKAECECGEGGGGEYCLVATGIKDEGGRVPNTHLLPPTPSGRSAGPMLNLLYHGSRYPLINTSRTHHSVQKKGKSMHHEKWTLPVGETPSQ